MPHRNRVVALFVMPVAVFLWLIGWTLTYIGSKQTRTPAKAPAKPSITFAVLPPETQTIPQTH